MFSCLSSSNISHVRIAIFTAAFLNGYICDGVVACAFMGGLISASGKLIMQASTRKQLVIVFPQIGRL